MAPSKANIGDMEGSSSSEGQGVLGLTSSLAHLTLHPDTTKDLAKLEATLTKVTLDNIQTQKEDLHTPSEEEEEEEVEEKQDEKGAEERKAKEEEKKMPDNAKEEKRVVYEKEQLEREIIQGSKKKEESRVKDKKEEKGEEENKEEDDKDEEKVEEDKTEDKEEKEDKSSQIVKEEEKEKFEEKKEEEEVSDDENPTEEETDSQTKKQKFRPRGLQHGVGQGYASTSHLDYHGLQQQQQMQMHSPHGSHYIGVASPQYGHVAGYAGASPTHSGATGDMGDSDSPQMAYGGYGAMDSPNPQYQDGNSNYYPSPQCQGSPYSQYQPSPAYSYHPSPPYYPENALNSYQDMNYRKGGYQDEACQDIGYQEPLFPNACMSHPIQDTIITPPTSPPDAETLTTAKGSIEVGEIIEAFASAMKDDDPRIPQDESKIIAIKRSLMDITQCSNLKEELNQEKYMEYYRACARHTDEELVKMDEDGDNMMILAASQGQEQPGYTERLVAITERVENINLCCNTVVDWHINQCKHCGNADRERFYSPLSWMNKYGQMVLSNVVMMLYPLSVVQYLTGKVMQRPMDFKRTFTKHYSLFFNNKHLYPCLAEPLGMLNSMDREHRTQQHGISNTCLA